MASFNKVLLMGNLTRDPQLRYLPNNTPVAEFGVACNRKYKTAAGEEREEVTFVDVSVLGKLAEIVSKYFQKGRPIFVEGRLKFDTWEDKQGGGKRSKLSVVMENFQFIGGRGDGGEGGPPAGEEYDSRPRQGARPAARPAGNQSRPQSDEQAPPIGEDEHFKPDDIPF
jgi:single-strand DNA-binding protein